MNEEENIQMQLRAIRGAMLIIGAHLFLALSLLAWMGFDRIYRDMTTQSNITTPNSNEP